MSLLSEKQLLEDRVRAQVEELLAVRAREESALVKSKTGESPVVSMDPGCTSQVISPEQKAHSTTAATAMKRPPPDEDDPGSALLAKTKKRREDVTARHTAHDDTNVTVVKTTFNSFCTPEAKALPWEDTLKDMNKTVLEAYVLANLHVLRLCKLGQEIDELSQTFFYRCLSAVSVGLRNRSAITDARFRESVRLYKSLRDPNTPFASSAYISNEWHQNASQTMASNTKNAVGCNFYRRFHKQIKRMYDMDGKSAYDMLKSILDPEYVGDNPEVLAWRMQIPRKGDGNLDTKNAHRLLPLTFMFLSDIEEQNWRFARRADYKLIRTFRLLPAKKTFGCCHFKMCSLGLNGLLKRAGGSVDEVLPDREHWTEVADEWWRRLFKIGKFETATRTFAGEVMTDGKAVSIVLRKPSREPEEHPLSEKDYNILWGLDPGRRDMFVATNQAGETTRCSSREFYEDAYYTKSNQKVKLWQRQRPDILESHRNMPTNKTASLERLETFIQFMTSRMDTLLEFTCRSRSAS